MSNIVEFKRKSPKPKSSEILLVPPTAEQLSGFIATVQYLVDLNQSDSAILDIDADGEFHIALRGLQDYNETGEVVSGCNLELNATGDLDFKDIPSSIATIQEMIKRVDLDNIPDPDEKK